MSDATQPRPAPPVPDRAAPALPTGARLMLLAAVLIAVLGGYLMFAPITRVQEYGKTIDCGTLVNPPSTDFVLGLCGAAGDQREAQVLAVGVAAVVMGAAGPLVFGVRRRPERVS